MKVTELVGAVVVAQDVILAILLVGGVAVMAWVLVAPLLWKVVENKDWPALFENLFRASIALVLAATVFRVAFPKSSAWFAHLGDYFTPVLTLISLTVLAAALGLQRVTLEQTRNNLMIAQEQILNESRARQLEDAAVVLIADFEPRLDEALVDVALQSGGAGAAVNIEVEVVLSGEEGRVSIGRGALAALFRGAAEIVVVRIPRERAMEFEERLVAARRFVVSVRWCNVHLTEFSYETSVECDGDGNWRVVQSLDFRRPKPQGRVRGPKDMFADIRGGGGVTKTHSG